MTEHEVRYVMHVARQRGVDALGIIQGGRPLRLSYIRSAAKNVADPSYLPLLHRLYGVPNHDPE